MRNQSEKHFGAVTSQPEANLTSSCKGQVGHRLLPPALIARRKGSCLLMLRLPCPPSPGRSELLPTLGWQTLPALLGLSILPPSTRQTWGDRKGDWLRGGGSGFVFYKQRDARDKEKAVPLLGSGPVKGPRACCSHCQHTHRPSFVSLTRFRACPHVQGSS